jgi:hypothetical protein
LTVRDTKPCCYPSSRHPVSEMILEVFSLLHRDALAISFKSLENHDEFNAGLEKGTCDSLCIASASSWSFHSCYSSHFLYSKVQSSATLHLPREGWHWSSTFKSDEARVSSTEGNAKLTNLILLFLTFVCKYSDPSHSSVTSIMSLLPAMISYLQYSCTTTDSVVLGESLMAMHSVLRYTNPSLDSEFWWDFCYQASCNPLWISGAFSYFTHGY